MNKNDIKRIRIVGTVRIMALELIETEIFIKDIERELINSGNAKFIMS